MRPFWRKRICKQSYDIIPGREERRLERIKKCKIRQHYDIIYIIIAVNQNVPSYACHGRFSRLEIICIHYYLNIGRVRYATIKIIKGYLWVSRHFFSNQNYFFRFRYGPDRRSHLNSKIAPLQSTRFILVFYVFFSQQGRDRGCPALSNYWRLVFSPAYGVGTDNRKKNCKPI